MNIILFDNQEIQQGIPQSDFRAIHIKNILKKSIGDSFLAGVLNNSKGTATISSIKDGRYYFTYQPTEFEGNCSPLSVLCGLPRPPVARRILKDCATAGICEIHFICVENGEKSFAQSKLWSTNDFMLALLEGAQQGGNFYLPTVTLWKSVSHLFSKKNFTGDLIMFDNKIGIESFKNHLLKPHLKSTVLAIGAERGWSQKEQENFIAAGFKPITLGKRIYRTEVALNSAIVMIQNFKEI